MRLFGVDAPILFPRPAVNSSAILPGEALNRSVMRSVACLDRIVGGGGIVDPALQGGLRSQHLGLAGSDSEGLERAFGLCVQSKDRFHEREVFA